MMEQLAEMPASVIATFPIAMAGGGSFPLTLIKNTVRLAVCRGGYCTDSAAVHQENNVNDICTQK